MVEFMSCRCSALASHTGLPMRLKSRAVACNSEDELVTVECSRLIFGTLLIYFACLGFLFYYFYVSDQVLFFLHKGRGLLRVMNPLVST